MNRLRFALRIVITVVVVATGVWLVREKWSWLTPVFEVAAPSLAIVLVLKLAIAIANAWKFDLVVRMFGLSLPPVEWIGLSAVTVFYGRLLPFRLGSAPRAVYLKKKYKFRYREYLSLMAGAFILESILSSWLGFGALVSRLPTDKPAEVALMGFFAAAAVGLVGGSLLGLYAAARQIPTGVKRLDRLIQELQTSVSYYRRGGPMILKSLAAAGVFILIQASSLAACFWALGQLPDPAVVLASASAGALSAIVSVTPGNLGVREGALIGTCVVLGVPASMATAAVILSRATSLVVQVSLGLVFSYVLFGSLKPPRDEPNAGRTGDSPEDAS